MYKLYSKCVITKLISLTALVDFHNPLYNKDFSFPGETHNFWEIMFIINGSAEVVCGGDVYILNGGQAFIHKPMDFHNIRPVGGVPVQAIILCFYANAMPDLPRRIFKFSSGTAEAFQALCRQCKSIFTYENGPDEPKSVIAGKEHDASMFLVSLEYQLHCLLNNVSDDRSPIMTKSAESYKIILDIMETNINKNLSLSDISNLCNMREPTLRKVFQQYTGISVMKYFNSMKIKKAIIYLHEGKSVKETSHLLGFDDQNYFSTVFKRITGTPPKQFIPRYKTPFNF